MLVMQYRCISNAWLLQGWYLGDAQCCALKEGLSGHTGEAGYGNGTGQSRAAAGQWQRAEEQGRATVPGRSDQPHSTLCIHTSSSPCIPPLTHPNPNPDSSTPQTLNINNPTPKQQVGCRHGGKWYADYQMIGGQHRYAVDQFGGGRHDPHALSAARCWWGANIAAAGIPMMFMGTECAQVGMMMWCSSGCMRRQLLVGWYVLLGCAACGGSC